METNLLEDPNAVQPTTTEAPSADVPQVAPSTAPVEARPVGTEEDFIQQQQEADPTGSELVSPEEQAQYTDFVRRCILFMSDDRKPGGADSKKKSPLEATLGMLNNPRRTVPEAIGETASNLVRIVVNAAQRAKQAYTPDVIFHGGMEVVEHLYALGASNGLFKGVPKPEGLESEDHEWGPEDKKIIEQSFSYAVTHFGKYLQDSGQLTNEQQEAATKFWKEQIAREVSAGEVPDSTFDGVDMGALRAQMQQKLSAQPQLLEE